MRFLVILTALLTGQLVFGDECTTVRLDLKPDGSSWDFPVRSQSDLGTCYAQAGTFLMDWWNATQVYGNDWNYNQHAISPVFAAMEYNSLRYEREVARGNVDTDENTGHTNLNGGFPCEVFNLIANSGGCAQSALRDSRDDHAFSELRDHYEASQRQSRDRRVTTATDVCAVLMEEFNISQEQLPGVTDILAALDSDNETEFYDNLFSGVCSREENRIPGFESRFQRPTCTTFPNIYQVRGNSHTQDGRDYPDPSAIVQQLNSVFNSDYPTPIGVNICTNIIYESQSVLQRQAGVVVNEGDCSTNRHAVVAMGRRFNPSSGKCEYLIRNSWGGYNGAHSRNGEAGVGFWINEDLLASNTVNLQIVRPPGVRPLNGQTSTPVVMLNLTFPDGSRRQIPLNNEYRDANIREARRELIQAGISEHVADQMIENGIRDAEQEVAESWQPTAPWPVFLSGVNTEIVPQENTQRLRPPGYLHSQEPIVQDARDQGSYLTEENRQNSRPNTQRSETTPPLVRAQNNNQPLTPWHFEQMRREQEEEAEASEASSRSIRRSQARSARRARRARNNDPFGNAPSWW